MYKKIMLLILCLIFAMSCSSPSSPDGTNQGDIVNGGGSGSDGGNSGSGGDSGNTGDGGSTGGEPWTPIEPPLMPPVPILDAEAMEYGIDISQDDAKIKEQIRTKLQKYRQVHGYGKDKVIFIGTPKKQYAQRNSLARLVLQVAQELSASEITIDATKIYFNERKIKSYMFHGGGGISLGYFNFKFIFPESSIRVIEGNAFSFLNNYLREIKIPDSVIGIKAAAFQADEVLKTITFTENSKLEYIGDYAFSYAIAKEILIPASVKLIGKSPFGNSLTTVTYLGTKPDAIQHSGDVFPSTAKTLILPNVADPKFDEWKNFLGGNFTEVKQHK